MRYLYNYGEGALCFFPVFLMAMIAAALLKKVWLSLTRTEDFEELRSSVKK